MPVTTTHRAPRRPRTALMLGLLVLPAGCGPRPQPGQAPLPDPGSRRAASAASLPELGPGRPITPGLPMYEVTVPGAPSPTRLRILLPVPKPAGKVPCVLIAPAGTRLFHGTTLGDGDSPEHLPYVQAGFAVVAYEIAGNLADNPTEFRAERALSAFKEAEGGIANARAALDYALAKLPSIDPNRIYVAGHSSAATLALQVAESDPRVKACAAYAPACDVAKRLGPEALGELDRLVPGARTFLEEISPIAKTPRLRCPLYLFHADDDDNVPTSDVAAFAEAVRKTNPHVTFDRVPSGGHYDSMIRQGIPRAIEWMKKL